MRHVDMVAVVKRAARYCGLEDEFYSSHSQRRGGASGYLLSGAMNLEEVRVYGRWKSLSSLKLYIEPGMGALAVDAQARVRSGHEDVNVMQMEPPRERAFMRMRAAKAVNEMRKGAPSR